jgi:hypothetical protein
MGALKVWRATIAYLKLKCDTWTLAAIDGDSLKGRNCESTKGASGFCRRPALTYTGLSKGQARGKQGASKGQARGNSNSLAFFHSSSTGWLSDRSIAIIIRRFSSRNADTMEESGNGKRSCARANVSTEVRGERPNKRNPCESKRMFGLPLVIKGQRLLRVRPRTRLSLNNEKKKGEEEEEEEKKTSGSGKGGSFSRTR